MVKLAASYAMIAALALGACGTPAQTGPNVTERTQIYTVTAIERASLIAEMNAKGPLGYWGRTLWTVTWTGACEVKVDILYILPKHRNPKALPAPLQRDFEQAMARLTAHERQHGQHGIQAAHALKRAGCRNAEAIVQQHSQLDRAYDKRTRHGVLEGATLN